MNFEQPPVPNNNENKEVSLESISKELGFIENTELLAIKNQFVLESGTRVNEELITKWRSTAEQLIDDSVTDGPERNKAILGYTLALVEIYKEFNDDEEAYYNTLDDALDLATNLKLDDIKQIITGLY
ncbi:MAG: hypothetical protein WCO58_01545 [bacterium]